jgi:glycosyltransferase involved in cell wall biosynthesis
VPVTNRFKEVLIERGVDGEKVDVVTNGVDLSEFTPAAEKDHSLVAEYGLADKFVAGYIGSHEIAQALHTVVRAAELLRQRDDIRFLFVGGGADRDNIESLVRTLELDNVVMLPRQPKQMMPAIWGLCDIALVPLKDEHEFTKVIPSKIFECMGMGLPMLLSVPPGEAAGIVEPVGAGAVVPPENALAMVQALTTLVDNRDQLADMAAASAASAARFDRKRLAQSMLGILQSVVD